MAESIVQFFKNIGAGLGDIYKYLTLQIPVSVLNLSVILIVFLVCLGVIILVNRLYDKYPITFKKTILIIVIVFIFLYLVGDFNNYLRFNPTGQKIVSKAQDFLTILLSILIESFPFIILGVTISTLVGIGFFEWLNNSILKYKKILFLLYFILLVWAYIDKLLGRFRLYSHLKATFIGIFLPVCECGNIPLARRLMIKGYSPSHAITFLLAAPILNPVTLYTTYIAFGAIDISVVFYRMLGGFLIAYFIGILFSFKKDQSDLITTEFNEIICDHDHSHDSEFIGKGLYEKIINKLKQAYDIFQSEFIDIFKVLTFGAVLASASQVFIHRDFILAIGSNAVFSIIAMIIFGFVISVCSNVDAFIALSFYRTFTKGSIVSFLVFGPMIDIKILTMMKRSFKTKTLVILTLLVTLLTVLFGLVINYFS